MSFFEGPKAKSLLGIFGDAMLGLAGQPGVYGPAMMRRREDEAARAREWDDWQQKEQWKLDNAQPAPTQTDRYLAELEDPNTPPQRKAMLRQILLRPIGVPVYGPDGSQRTEFYYPDQMPMGQQGGDDEWEYLDEGGASPSGAPRFR